VCLVGGLAIGVVGGVGMGMGEEGGMEGCRGVRGHWVASGWAGEVRAGWWLDSGFW
jgi:hypothetical protein